MSVQKDESGRKFVQAEVEVHGTPEQVWEAIATGPGISSWFVPSEVEEREGGAAVSHFGPGNSMDSVGTISKWNPPHSFVVDTPAHEGEAPPVATEWTVEARDGGKCVVRLVHRWFASTDDWDSQFEGHVFGWNAFFRILRLRLEHFAGQPAAQFQAMAMVPSPKTEAWSAFTTGLGFGPLAVGDVIKSVPGAPALSGVVEEVGPPGFAETTMLLLDTPNPGIASFFAMEMGGPSFVFARLYLYGPHAAATVEREEPVWNEWLGKTFPPPTE